MSWGPNSKFKPTTDAYRIGMLNIENKKLSTALEEIAKATKHDQDDSVHVIASRALGGDE